MSQKHKKRPVFILMGMTREVMAIGESVISSGMKR